MLDLPFADDSFDMVFSHGVLHHVPAIKQAQSEIHAYFAQVASLSS